MFKQQPFLGIQPGKGCLIFSGIYFGYKMKYARLPVVLPLLRFQVCLNDFSVLDEKRRTMQALSRHAWNGFRGSQSHLR
ncbi:hypothetical protein [Paenibacillus sp. SN-8-1]|uniref:hypothetical protein n=1 Tax=Paenibacillus sp. SN-8-1 TaxID=3435409 RepID=UPI003D9A44F3